jgi:cell division transport system permease protein
VGAKRGFIVRPFLSKSILYGFLGAVIAIVLLAVLVVVFNSRFNYIDINDTTTRMVLSAIAGVIVVFGIAISFISTYFSVRYYLNHKDEQLY